MDFHVRPAVLHATLLAAIGCGDPAAPEPPACSERSGTICTWAGTGDAAFDGEGRDRRDSSLYWVTDLEFSPDGRAYIVDWQNHRIRRVNDDGRLETVIGTDSIGDGPADLGDTRDPGSPGTQVDLNHPTDIQFFADGTMLLAAWHNHKLRRFDPTSGLVRVTCGGSPGFAGDGGPASQARLSQPKAIAVSASGNIFIADSRNQRIRRITPDDVIATVVGTGRPGSAGDGGAPLLADLHLQKDGDNPEPGGSLAIDGAGRVYVADTENHRIRVVDVAAQTIETVAGTGEKGFSGDGGPATAARLRFPRDLEIGPDGRLYIADTDNHRVRALDLATGTISTVAGSGERGFGGDGGPATAARLERPFGIAFDPGGHLYIADTFNNRIRRVAR